MNEALLIRFLTHTCTSTDYREIEAWIALDKANAAWLFDMERIWSLKNELRFSDKKEIEKAYSRFMAVLPHEVKLKTSKNVFNFRTKVQYAVAVILVVLLFSNIYMLTLSDTKSFNTIEVPNGQRVSMTLSDGTKVWLNSETKFIYPSQFSAKNRKVRLEGEAFFEVAHNRRKPFIVNTSLIDVKVLGTKFNVRTYPQEYSVVTLTDGKVEVESIHKESKLTLRPHEQVVYSVKTGMVLKKNVDTRIVESWTKGEIAFVNMPLATICRELERKFDVVVEISDNQLAEDAFTCRFKETASIEQILSLLKETRRLDYSFNNQQIRIFTPKKKMPME